MATVIHTMLCFFSGSKDAKPGKGVGETVCELEGLAGVKDWRRVLSNFHVAPFVYGGLTWNSIEHAFQGHKIMLADREKGFAFAMESGSELSRDTGAAAQKQRKMVKLSGSQLAQWNSTKMKIMEEAAAAMYSQNEKEMAVLKMTKNTELWHRGPRIKPVRFVHLERIRNSYLS